MPGSLVKLAIAAAILLGGPLLGVRLAGRPVAPYLAFPPLTAPVTPPPFSWPVFVVLAVLVAAVVAPIWIRAARARAGLAPGEGAARAPAPGRFPWWGWAGAALLGASWVLAWTRFPWFAAGQEHTFTPLWLGYVATVNGLCHRRTGTCPMISDPGGYLLLFPLSAVFWWFFEYLNRFVGNWHYVGVEDYSPAAYVAFASISFATVLPAVIGTRAWLASFPVLDRPFRGMWVVSLRRSRPAAAVVLALTAASAVGIGAWPEGLFPLVWVSPLLVIFCLQLIAGDETVLHPLQRGDWRPVCQPALAALACGFLWELWNSASLAHWEYTIPWVDRYHLFEMPLLGYAGYLPFGLECVVAASLVSPTPAGTRRRGPARAA